MTKELSNNHYNLFEQIRKTDEQGNEYWSARDLSKALDYTEYWHFLPVVARAKEACKNSGQQEADHFEDVLEMKTTGKTAQRKVESAKLSRYAYYLIVLNADIDDAIFQNHGYIGLYGGLDAKTIHKKSPITALCFAKNNL